ncbi:GDSL esterase/lipase At5g45920-like [Salvia miltiorrhiza]|uniref:GDSL esterase/lipase At5g45920-like n=1 Tax=Salvia miltiorrhiza TaxID=226208 RepID=UPI0025ABF40C|nr:GDSL esterase/lipase At5g45920-like [Salvia miltiorrhiza]
MRPKIYLFGDSITEMSFGDGGWGASLANHFARQADVVLRGYGGYNTRWALKVIHKIFPATGEAPLAVTVFFGANDLSLPDRYCGSLHVPLDEYKHNLLAIVAFFKKQWPSTRIILITPPPIDEDARHLNPFDNNSWGPPDRTNEVAGRYAKHCLDVAAECGLPAIPLWQKMQQLPDWKKALLCDGLHPTQQGNKFVFEEVINLLAQEQISLETLPADFPLISEMDLNDPLKSFAI